MVLLRRQTSQEATAPPLARPVALKRKNLPCHWTDRLASIFAEMIRPQPTIPLIFRANGEVRGCFHLPGWLLGRFPESSLEEIWTGPVAREFRDGLKNGDLSK